MHDSFAFIRVLGHQDGPRTGVSFSPILTSGIVPDTIFPTPFFLFRTAKSLNTELISKGHSQLASDWSTHIRSGHHAIEAGT